MTANVLAVQKSVLGQLMSDAVASRLLDSEGKADRSGSGGSAEVFQLTELHSRLTREIWSELGSAGDIPALRRELQRDHVNRLAGGLLRPGSASRTDTRSLLRGEALALQARIERASRRQGLSEAARAHLADAVDTLSRALTAPLQRAGA